MTSYGVISRGRASAPRVQMSVARAKKITEGGGMELLPAMGANTALNVQPTGDGKAATTGDFVPTTMR